VTVFRVSTVGFPASIVIAGEIDLATAPRVDSAFATVTGDVRVDCSEVTFVDSAGFHALDRAYEAAVRRGNSFTLSGLRPFPSRIADLLHVPYAPSARG
jgi:anti-anti-sigma factor